MSCDAGVEGFCQAGRELLFCQAHSASCIEQKFVDKRPADGRSERHSGVHLSYSEVTDSLSLGTLVMSVYPRMHFILRPPGCVPVSVLSRAPG